MQLYTLAIDYVMDKGYNDEICYQRVEYESLQTEEEILSVVKESFKKEYKGVSITWNKR